MRTTAATVTLRYRLSPSFLAEHDANEFQVRAFRLDGWAEVLHERLRFCAFVARHTPREDWPVLDSLAGAQTILEAWAGLDAGASAR